MHLHLDMVIIFVHDLEKSTRFYTETLGIPVAEERDGWVLLKAGQVPIGLHKAGEGYAGRLKDERPSESSTKLVFETTEDLTQLRHFLISRGIPMRELKTFAGYDYLLCDGEDPEGNVFQLKQKINQS